MLRKTLQILGVFIALNSESVQAVTLPALDGDNVKLGHGLDLIGMKIRPSKCIDGDYAYSGESTSIIAAHKTLDENQLSMVNSTSLSGRVNLFVGSAELSGVFNQALSVNQSSLTLAWGRIVKGKSVVLQNPKLTEHGKRAINSGDPVFRSLLCGQEVVNQIDLGGSIILLATIQFANASYKDEMMSKVEFKSMGFKKTREIRGGNEWGDKFSFIAFTGIQIGGQPKKLTELLQTLNTTKCTFEDMKPCEEAIDKLNDYAFADDGFTSQLNNLEYSHDGGFSPYFIHTIPYQHYAFPDLNTFAWFDFNTIKKIIEDIGAVYTEYWQDYKNVLEQLKSGRLDIYEIRKLEIIRDAAWYNMRILLEIKDLCHKTPSLCQNRWNNSGVKPYDRNEISVKERLKDYCLMGEKSPKLRLLMNKLYEQTGGTCEKLTEKYASITNLNISNLGLDTLAPLKFITNLRTLDASSNQLTNVQEILHLAQLETLNLKNNKIKNIAPIAANHKIKTLNLAYNHIEDANNFTSNQIKKLRLHGNPLRKFDQIELRRSQYQNLTLSEDDLCEQERLRQESLGLDLDLMDVYRANNFAPIYTIANDPHSTVSGWMSCEYVAPDYE